MYGEIKGVVSQFGKSLSGQAPLRCVRGNSDVSLTPLFWKSLSDPTFRRLGRALARSDE